MQRACNYSAALSAILLAVLGCGEDTESPTAPQAAPLVASATQGLAFSQVSGGAAHSCGVTTDNQAYCWGSGFWGQLGNGDTGSHYNPFAVAGTLRFRQVSAGGLHTCGVTTDNRAYCWGSNGDGALGDGTTIARLKPVAVKGGRLFRQVSAGESFTCGVSYPDNRAYCWGYNGLGQLGNGTNTPRLAPVAVAGGRQFRHVSAGQLHTCGVTTGDRAFCWGSNQFGQIGDSSEAAVRLTPSPVAGTRRFRQIDAGAFFTCAVTTGDRAFCWGNGRTGQIGDGKTFLRFWPRAVAGGLSIDRVSAGGFHACGETTDNRAYCWGWNLEGAVGDGTKTMRLTPVPVVGGLLFSQVSAGYRHTCARTPGAVAYCWGEPLGGQLGTGINPPDPTRPNPVAGPL